MGLLRITCKACGVGEEAEKWKLSPSNFVIRTSAHPLITMDMCQVGFVCPNCSRIHRINYDAPPPDINKNLTRITDIVKHLAYDFDRKLSEHEKKTMDRLLELVGEDPKISAGDQDPEKGG